ncbi:MAG: hypothetical protein TRG1_2986 [Flavobacteriaceae bacterium FS1-H7996/R]|nr:MAG: hypothetical protein TRG1_2986 [Flavobacteriaceae bacterium FS1-H7996/R]
MQNEAKSKIMAGPFDEVSTKLGAKKGHRKTIDINLNRL